MRFHAFLDSSPKETVTHPEEAWHSSRSRVMASTNETKWSTEYRTPRIRQTKEIFEHRTMIEDLEKWQRQFELLKLENYRELRGGCELESPGSKNPHRPTVAGSHKQ